LGAVNDSLDARYSRPKTIATALIRFHVGRGDRIVFITSRCASSPPNDLTARYLATLFDLEELPTVRFTDLGRKVAAFQDEKPAIAYGDADSDIEDTIKASEGMPDTPIRAVRIMRSSFSSNPGAQNPGKFGEDVILVSDH
jgi:acid phosphatase class B